VVSRRVARPAMQDGPARDQQRLRTSENMQHAVAGYQVLQIDDKQSLNARQGSEVENYGMVWRG
jgi:hypothetical protein